MIFRGEIEILWVRQDHKVSIQGGRGAGLGNWCIEKLSIGCWRYPGGKTL